MSILKDLTNRAVLEARLNAPVEGTEMDAPNQKGIAKQMGMGPNALYTANTRHAGVLEELGSELQGRLDHVTQRAWPMLTTHRIEREFPNPDLKDAVNNPTVKAYSTESIPEKGIYEGKYVAAQDAPKDAAVYEIGMPKYSGKVEGQPYRQPMKKDAPGISERLAYAQGHMDKFRAALTAHKEAHNSGDSEGAMRHMLAATDHLIDAANAATASRPDDDKKAIGLPAGDRSFKRWAGTGSSSGILSDNWKPEGLPWKPTKIASGPDKYKASEGLSDWVSLENLHPQVQTILGAYRKHVANTVGLPDSAYYDPKVAGGRTYNRHSVSPTAFADERLTNELVVKARGGRDTGEIRFAGFGDEYSKDRSLSQSGAPMTIPSRPDSEKSPSWYETRPSIVNPKAPWSNPNMSADDKFAIAQRAHQAWTKENLGRDYFKSPAYNDHEGYLGIASPTSMAHAKPEIRAVLDEAGLHDDDMDPAIQAAQADFEKDQRETRSSAFDIGQAK